MGLNVGGGVHIKLRLRRPNRDWDFIPFDQVLDTMLHELCHNAHGPRNVSFYKLWDELRKLLLVLIIYASMKREQLCWISRKALWKALLVFFFGTEVNIQIVAHKLCIALCDNATACFFLKSWGNITKGNTELVIYTGDSAAIKVLRNCEILDFNIKLESLARLVPANTGSKPPLYYIIGGFVFTTGSIPYLASEYPNVLDVPIKLCDKMLQQLPQSLDEQLVVVSQVLVADINVGHEGIVNTQVLAFNGKPVRNLKSLASMIESCDEVFLKFDISTDCSSSNIDRQRSNSRYSHYALQSIPSAMSNDLKQED